MVLLKYLLLTTLLSMLTLSVQSQGLIENNSAIRSYMRSLEIQGVNSNNPLFFYTNKHETDSVYLKSSWGNQFSKYYSSKTQGPSLQLISPELNYVYSSKYSRSYNDGPIWSGRGSTSGLSLGMKFSWGPVIAVIYPTIYHSQNKSFATGPNTDPNIFTYQFSPNIDWVQRYGQGSFTKYDWGQSSIQANFGNLKIKFGKENIWWGSSMLNPIIFSNTASGFPHLNIGTGHPIITKFGDFEVNSIWGQLKESSFFDNNNLLDDRRFIAALFFGYRPSFSKFFKGFSVGIGRVLYQEWPSNGLSVGDLALSLKNTDPTTTVTSTSRFNDDTDQYLSLNLRWVLEDAKTEFYMEWVRNDFWLDFKDLVSEPEHGSVFTFGFQKVINNDKHPIKIGFEHTTLSTTRTLEIRDSDVIYLHTIVRQGFTHNGQLLGAPIGPGSKSQSITLDRFDDNGSFGFSFNRIRFNEASFYNAAGFRNNAFQPDVELNFEIKGYRFYKNYEFGVSAIYSRRINWYFNDNSDLNNYQIIAKIRWHVPISNLLSTNDSSR